MEPNEGPNAQSMPGSMGELADRSTEPGFPQGDAGVVSGNAYTMGSEAMNGGQTDEGKY